MRRYIDFNDLAEFTKPFQNRHQIDIHHMKWQDKSHHTNDENKISRAKNKRVNKFRKEKNNGHDQGTG